MEHMGTMNSIWVFVLGTGELFVGRLLTAVPTAAHVFGSRGGGGLEVCEVVVVVRGTV
jgi:hypothetical protein